MNEPRIYGFYEFYELKKQHLLMLWGYAPKNDISMLFYTNV